MSGNLTTAGPSAIEIAFGASSLLSFLVGTTGNIIAVFYFLKRSTTSTANTIIYACINITDTTICSLVLFTGLANLSPALGEQLFSNSVFCNVWGVLWNMIVRLSVYLIGVLSVSRVVSLYRPYQKMRRRTVLLPIIVYFLLMVFQAAMPFYHGRGYRYFPEHQVCSWSLGEIFDSRSVAFNFWFFVLTVLEFVVPVVPVTACCCLLMYKLRAKHSISERMNVIKREATITIVLLTVTYLVFNVPLCTVVLLNYSSKITEIHGHSTPSHTHFSFNYDKDLRSFINTQTIVLNCVANTCLYFYRIGELREWARGLARALWEGCCGGSWWSTGKVVGNTRNSTA